MGRGKARDTVSAATGRRDRDCQVSGAEGPVEEQQEVAHGLYEKAVREGRPYPGTAERDE